MLIIVLHGFELILQLMVRDCQNCIKKQRLSTCLLAWDVLIKAKQIESKGMKIGHQTVNIWNKKHVNKFSHLLQIYEYL